MPAPILVLVLAAAVTVVPAVTGSFWATVFALAVTLIANPIVRTIRKNRYFASETFQTLKAEIASVVAEHNEIVNYVEEIRTHGSFELGSSSTGQHAHLASFENTSAWNNRRDRHVAQYAPHVHNASLQIVRNASTDPLKYLMKYFSIKADQNTLADVQRVADDISRLESAVANVKQREADIAAKINPPAFILQRYRGEFWDQIGVHLSPIRVPYPQYRFEYVSAGGNSSQTTTIDLNTVTLEELAATLVDKIRWTKSAAGQRALMTNHLRGWIKQRDNFACLNCGVSLAAEPHLLLEVDHIMPVSKGGLSVPENLQTLCWKCNRSKGARVVS
ncbi:MAG: HNH endonuclease [Cellulomonadaceae bacterium]|nr:HNH endonuclease [Cellulomonadaceae bacterium]